MISSRIQPQSPSSLKQAAVGLLCAGLLALGAPAGAAPAAQAQSAPAAAPASASDSGAMQALKDKRAELRGLVERLSTIERKTLKAHPELEKQQNDYRDLVVEKMKEQGQDIEASAKRMKELQTQLSDKDLPKDKRESMMEELRTTSQAMREAQEAAVKLPEVKQAQKDLAESMMSAMKDTDPDVVQVLRDIRQTRNEYRDLMRSAQGAQ